MQRDDIEKIYAALLGMNAGIRLGAAVENPFWTYERIQDYYGDIRGYLRTCRHFTADDDVNGPVYFLRALTDNGTTASLTPEMVGEAWLNYTRRRMGMFWWGGEDLSTEHRAYMNLKRGISPPESGSIAQNGKIAAEQIGGQIFVDTWGLIWPGQPHRAAEYARIAASVSHDGSGLHGAAFMAGAIAAAFVSETLDDLLDAGLEELPAGCEYRQAVESVRSFHAAHPEDFRLCRDFIAREWSNDRFPGGYHIVPNAAICVLSMLYGGGELGRAIEIAVMCGYDTDCNAGNIGTILGAFRGLSGVPERYRKPINDNVILSGVSGYLNMLDLPTYALELADIACRLRGEMLPPEISLPRPGDLWMDFGLPGSLHGLEMSDWTSHNLRWTETDGCSGVGCAELMIDGKLPCPVDLFFKAMYTRPDLNEERYDPVFAPRVYPGQTVSCRMKSCQSALAKVTVTPYLTQAMTGRRIDLPSTVLRDGEPWALIAFTVPDLGGDAVHNVGWNIALEPESQPWAWGKVFVDDILVTGPIKYTIDMSIQEMQFGQLTPFSFNDCAGERKGDAMHLTMPEDPLSQGGQAFTGNYYLRQTAVEATAEIRTGQSALLLLRGQGTRRYYALGFAGAGKVAALRFENGVRTVLTEASFTWEQGRKYRLRAAAEKDRLTLCVDGVPVLTASDDRLAYGMPGLGLDTTGECAWQDLHISGSCLS